MDGLGEIPWIATGPRQKVMDSDGLSFWAMISRKPSSQVEVKEGTPRDKPFKGITTQINLAELSRTITKLGPCSFGGCYYMLLLAGFTSHIKLLASKRSRKCNPQSVINWNTPPTNFNGGIVLTLRVL